MLSKNLDLKTLENIYNEIGLSLILPLKVYAETFITSKIHKYETENLFFEKKYNCFFEVFKRKIENIENEEDFEIEDDLMDWEFAIKNLEYWNEQLKRLG